MLLPILLAVASITPMPAPQMHVQVRDLDFSRPEHVTLFVDRTRAASRDFCARHIAFVTPQSISNPRVCESGMSHLAARALPSEAFALVQASGQLRRFR